MISIPFSNVEIAIKNCEIEINKYSLQIYNKLFDVVNDGRIKGSKKEYLRYMLKVSNNLITAKPSTLIKYKKEFDRIIDSKIMKTSQHKNFRYKILKILDYSQRRSDFYPEYFQHVGIKTCIYCNAALAVSVETVTATNKKKSIKAKFQVDHYLPKSEYPCFSISLYNLYPACASCNNSKSTKIVQFRLYDSVNNIKVSPFKFDLDKVSVATFLLRRNRSGIKYLFQEPKTAKGVSTFDDTFAIQGIYDTQKDIAEELILKAEVYTAAYKKTLKTKYPSIFTNSDIVNRLIIGNYASEKDIHKRPMSKFMIDIAKQVGLI